jgi:hypothetical protein
MGVPPLGGERIEVRDFGWVNGGSGVVTALDERTELAYSRESAGSYRHFCWLLMTT